MAEIKLIRNGVKKAVNRRRRRKNVTRRANPIAKVANKRKRRRRNGVTAVMKRSNGVKAVANRRRRHHKRRNGAVISRQNGLLGNSRETITSVAALLIGLGVTKVESSILTPIAANALGMVGFGSFAKPAVEAAVAVTVNKWAADAIKKGSGKFVMYGGLAMALMSVLEQFLPSTSAYNPFASTNTSPVVLNQPVIAAPNALGAASNAPNLGGIFPRPVMRGRRPVIANSF